MKQLKLCGNLKIHWIFVTESQLTVTWEIAMLTPLASFSKTLKMQDFEDEVQLCESVLGEIENYVSFGTNTLVSSGLIRTKV